MRCCNCLTRATSGAHCCTTSSTLSWSCCSSCTSTGGYWYGAWLWGQSKPAGKFQMMSALVQMPSISKKFFSFKNSLECFKPAKCTTFNRKSACVYVTSACLVMFLENLVSIPFFWCTKPATFQIQKTKVTKVTTIKMTDATMQQCSCSAILRCNWLGVNIGLLYIMLCDTSNPMPCN